jgi:hypothetical protein
MAFLGFAGLIFAVFAGTIVPWFTDDPQVVPIAVQALRLLSYGNIAYAWGMVVTAAFNGAGDTFTPTVLNLLDIPVPARMRGTDLGPWLADTPAPASRLPPAFAEVEDKRMVVSGTDKLLCDLRWGSCAYYDLAADPHEQRNLAEARPDRAAALRAVLDDWLDGHVRFEPLLAKGWAISRLYPDSDLLLDAAATKRAFLGQKSRGIRRIEPEIAFFDPGAPVVTRVQRLPMLMWIYVQVTGVMHTRREAKRQFEAGCPTGPSWLPPAVSG